MRPSDKFWRIFGHSKWFESRSISTNSRIPQPYNIRVAHKPTTTLRQLLTNDKDKDEPNNRQGAVYKIKCSDCQASYIRDLKQTLEAVRWRRRWPRGSGLRPPPLGAKLEHYACVEASRRATIVLSSFSVVQFDFFRGFYDPY